MQVNVDTFNEDEVIEIDSEGTMSIPSIDRLKFESDYPVLSSSESTITASSKGDTIHSAPDIDTDGIPILHEAVDTKPNQIHIFKWNRNETSVKDISRDAFSKLGQAFAISNKSAPEVVRALIKYFSYYGTPCKINADPGTEFNNALLKEILQFYKIDLHISTPHNPNSMGLIERFHSTLIEIYRLAKYEHKITDAASVMTYAIMSYNQTIHSVTGLTPFEVVFGHTDASNAFNVDFYKQYTQKLVKDHVRRTKHLYKYLTDKMVQHKTNIKEKRGGEKEFDMKEGDVIFVKGVNTRRSKDKPRYQKAQITGEVVKNIIPVQIHGRDTKVPIKDVKRPTQLLKKSF
ncbi:integrase core domain-containing protein [Phthorimaea operculella]|nr:integrase core domain-containing protein [Phthorimaea operculella]